MKTMGEMNHQFDALLLKTGIEGDNRRDLVYHFIEACRGAYTRGYATACREVADIVIDKYKDAEDNGK